MGPDIVLQIYVNKKIVSSNDRLAKCLNIFYTITVHCFVYINLKDKIRAESVPPPISELTLVKWPLTYFPLKVKSQLDFQIQGAAQ